MARLLPSNRTQRDAENDAGPAVRELDARTALLGVGALAAGYLVGRRVLGTAGPSTDALRERAGEALPGDGVDVPIGGNGEDGESTGEDEEMPDEGAAGTDPSLEEIDERTESDVQAEPAEPGEMHVDEDLVDEAIDEDELEE